MTPNGLSSRIGSEPPPMKGRVEFPILDSKEPGTLSLSNADIEELLA